jgi:hypothetical protein
MSHRADATVAGAHRRSEGLSRRRLLGLAGLVAVPAAAFGLHRMRADEVPAGTTPTPVGTDIPARATPSPSRTTAEPPAVVTKGGGPVPFRNGKAMLGAYLALSGMSPSEALALRRRQFGRDERIVHLFYGWTDPLPRSVPYLSDSAVPMISWRGCDYGDILDGSSDALIERAARNLRKLRRPTLLRWAWEMNGDWYEWGGPRNDDDPAGFVRCWQRLRGIFADQNADNVSWVWSVNWNNSPNESWNRFQHYYPGDEHVDWVGMSGYNLHRELPDTLFAGVYAAYATKKPIMISEVGAVDRGGTTKADWITAFGQWAQQHPAVGAVTWFDTDTHPGYDENWRVDTDPEALAAYRAMARNPRFAG